MALTPIKIPALQSGRAIVDSRGAPQTDFQTWINTAFKQLKDAQNETNAALVAAGLATAAAAAATAAAAAANDAADASAAETSIQGSYVLQGSFAGASPIETDSTGNVTIKAHTRRYGDSTLNPDVNLVGGVVATGQVNPAMGWIYYIDATRANTNPTLLFTVDPAPQPAQSGDTHVIGQYAVPAAGSSDGGYVRPPGSSGAIP